MLSFKYEEIPSLNALMLLLPQPLFAIIPVSSALVILQSFGVLGRQRVDQKLSPPVLDVIKPFTAVTYGRKT